MATRALAQLSSGLILGLSSVIYAVSYAALMFSGPLARYVGYGIAICLVTAAIGAMYGRFSEEPTLVSGPEANTTSVLAGILAAAVATGGAHASGTLNQALTILLFASVFTSACFLLIERFHLARLVRFIPFQVTAGFLASTGWLMLSGALNIIAGTPLTLQGLRAFIEQPWRPELAASIGLVAILALMHQFTSAALAIPAFVVGVTIAVNIAVRTCDAALCDPSIWFFAAFDQLHWVPPWDLQFDMALLYTLVELLPSFLALAFISTLTILLSMNSLELSYGRDFRLESALRLHGSSNFLTTLLGGYVGAISIARSNLCRNTGGGPFSGFVSAAVCVGVLLGLGSLLAWVPRAALGALLMFMGLTMLRQWLWDVRTSMRRSEWVQVVGILVCVVAFGYVVGFLAGLLAACIFFVVNYSRMPFIALDTTIASVRSTVIRGAAEQARLAELGEHCRVGRFKGFVFFGVASAIYDWYRAGDPQKHTMVLLDFSQARGIDPSALAVLEKIVRNQTALERHLVLVVEPALARKLAGGDSPLVHSFEDFDQAAECAEELILAQAHATGTGVMPSVLLGADAPANATEVFRRYLEPVELKAGDYLFREGQHSDEMYFVEDGSLEVVKATLDGRSLRLCKVRSGAILGEMALYTGQPRSASAVAVEPSTLSRLTREARERLQAEHPAVAGLLDKQVVMGLASNLSRTNTLLRLQVG
ncbi:cyclic nucleotide-binding domain-containing protein [Ramlibacter albus]|uniref:SLC26A/SulP transporter family protein n=1 Tax=Ramlibacter albus TaxID=2079448 RepID=A0A923S7J8_9BURK|nr:cyclic nucleotide-binding domain-containing protein [Ramlibacter albus]MBC5767197.1 SLC26A/SulP transporter family protein [Ramlibacter albus]